MSEFYNNENNNTEAAAEDQEINLDAFFEEEDPDNPLSDSLTDIIKAANEGEVSIGVFITNPNGDAQIVGEYDDCRVNISVMGDTTVCSFVGSKDSLDGMWRAMNQFKSLLGDRTLREMQREGELEDEAFPLCTFIIVPGDYFGQYYIELNCPKLWAFSAEAFGMPSTELLVAFPTELSDVCEMENDGSGMDDIGDILNGGASFSDENYSDDYSAGDPWFQNAGV